MWMSIAKGARYACCDNVTFRAMVMQGVIPRYPSLNPNSSREVVRSEDIDAAIMARGAVPALPSPDCVPARRPRRVACDLIWDAGCRLGEWWNSLPERVRSVACAVAMLALLAIAGAIEGTAPSGMYY